MEEIRLMVERREKETLSEFAQLASESAGRAREETPDPIRTCFQRDRDRILHCKPFRRLKHKTQVFIDPTGDHYRTRLTHTLEVSQIARTVARALRLNEDLTEAVALGHDVGHPPFGHGGEQALDEALKDRNDPEGPSSFRHDEHSLRVLDVLVPLNLTLETRLGVSGHSKGKANLSDSDGVPTSTLEAAVVRVCDRVAYLNHDLDDAIRWGIVAAIPTAVQNLGRTQGERVGSMVGDLIRNSMDSPSLAFSATMTETLNEFKDWMYKEVYLRAPEPSAQVIKAKRLVKALFEGFASGEVPMPEGFTGTQGAVDYIAGMTDRFAIATFTSMFVPNSTREGNE